MRRKSVLEWLRTQSIERDTIEPVKILAKLLPGQPNSGEDDMIDIVIATTSSTLSFLLTGLLHTKALQYLKISASPKRVL